VERRVDGEARRGFYQTLDGDPIVELGAQAILFGIDPVHFTNQGDEDYPILVSMLNRAVKLDHDKREYNALLIASKLAKFLGG
jgi:hypothetical protein